MGQFYDFTTIYLKCLRVTCIWGIRCNVLISVTLHKHKGYLWNELKKYSPWMRKINCYFFNVILNGILIPEFFEVFFLQPPDTWLKRASDCMIAINNLCWHSSDSPHSDLTNFRTLQTGAHKNHLCRVVSSERSRTVTYFQFHFTRELYQRARSYNLQQAGA